MDQQIDRKTILKELDKILELPLGTLNGAERLQDLENWDSLAIMSVVALVDESFGVVLSSVRIIGCETIDDLISLIAA